MASTRKRRATRRKAPTTRKEIAVVTNVAETPEENTVVVLEVESPLP
jgi:hypothetical protein